MRGSSPHARLLAAAGIEAVRGDLKDSASLRAACRGVESVISTATATTSRRAGDGLRAVDRDGQLALVEAAAAACVRRFVYVSLSPLLPTRSPLVRYKREVERAVRQSGMEWCILQPSCFMEIWLSPRLGWDVPRGRAVIFGDGRSPVSFVSVDDVAAAAMAAVDHPKARDVTIPVGGPRPVSPLEAVRAFEEATAGYSVCGMCPRRC